MDNLEALARRMMNEEQAIAHSGFGGPPEPMAVWVGYLYGYSLTQVEQWPNRNVSFTMHFVRDAAPEARRRAAWMRNPAADPGFPPPMTWRSDGGPGFHPPGWHPSVRLNGPPDGAITLPAAGQWMRHSGGLVRDQRGPGGAGIVVIWLLLAMVDACLFGAYWRGGIGPAVLIVLFGASVTIGASAHFGIRRYAERGWDQAKRSPAQQLTPNAEPPAPPPPPDTIAYPETRPRG